MEANGQLHALAALFSGKVSQVPIGWAPDPFWTRWWREKNSQLLYVFENVSL